MKKHTSLFVCPRKVSMFHRLFFVTRYARSNRRVESLKRQTYQPSAGTKRKEKKKKRKRKKWKRREAVVEGMKYEER